MYNVIYKGTMIKQFNDYYMANEYVLNKTIHEGYDKQEMVIELVK